MSDITISLSDTKVPDKLSCNIQVNFDIAPGTIPKILNSYSKYMPSFLPILLEKMKEGKYKSIEDLWKEEK